MRPLFTIYGTPWCGYCDRLLKQLDRAGVQYVYVDIDADAAAAEYVMGVNGGNRTVPTVQFEDGTALVNPITADVTSHLSAIATAR